MKRYDVTDENKYVVLVEIDGTVLVKEISSPHKAFDEAKPHIGCKRLEHFNLFTYKDHAVDALCNEDGYADWGLDPKKVNKVATFIYNGGNTGHFVLGNIVLCFRIEGDEGQEFVGMTKTLAEGVATIIREKIRPDAEKVVVVGDKIPEPQVSIVSFDTPEEFEKFMKGDEEAIKKCEKKSFGCVSGRKAN